MTNTDIPDAHATPGAPELGSIVTDPGARRVIYGTYGIVALAAAATTVGFATGGAVPEALVIANSVIAFLGAPIGGLAAANIRR